MHKNTKNKQNVSGEKNPVTHILVITEKPSVARTIARALGANERKDGYFEGRTLSGGQRFCADRSGAETGYIVSWCVGHLVELAPPGAYSDAWKKWSMDSLPMIPENWQTEVKESAAAQFSVLKELMHDSRVSEIVGATDVG